VSGNTIDRAVKISVDSVSGSVWVGRALNCAFSLPRSLRPAICATSRRSWLVFSSGLFRLFSPYVTCGQEGPSRCSVNVRATRIRSEGAVVCVRVVDRFEDAKRNREPNGVRIFPRV
jgi:hypothetical protein